MRLPPPFADDGKTLNAIVETPKGSRNKYVYDEKLDLLKIKKALPAGMSFPFDFGFIPSTMAEDGDPMDILVLTDAPTFAGCLVESKILGIIIIEQTEDGKTVRNDRVIAVQTTSRLYAESENIDDLPTGLVDEIVNFFASYHNLGEDDFKHVGNDGPSVAMKLVNDSIKKAGGEANTAND